jgi:hypothetical protein
VTDLRGYLVEPERPAAWFEAIRERVRLAEERKADKAQCDKGLHPHAAHGGGLVSCNVCGQEWSTEDEPPRKTKTGTNVS